jgi:hypothetical protein
MFPCPDFYNSFNLITVFFAHLFHDDTKLGEGIIQYLACTWIIYFLEVQSAYKLSEYFAEPYFHNTEQKYTMLLSFERRMFAVL